MLFIAQVLSSHPTTNLPFSHHGSIQPSRHQVDYIASVTAAAAAAVTHITFEVIAKVGVALLRTNLTHSFRAVINYFRSWTCHVVSTDSYTLTFILNTTV